MIPTNRPHPIASEVGDKAKFSVEVAVTPNDCKHDASKHQTHGTKKTGTAPSSTQGGTPDASESGPAAGQRASSAAERLIPIGQARLRALREAIRNGTYPAESDVVGGLMRVFHSEDDV